MDRGRWTTLRRVPDPVVSVVVPAYKQASLISACLDSIGAQSYRGAVEVIIVDDGCPDGTGNVAAAHALKPRVIRQSNQGVAAARNAGIAASVGPYIAFLDADDRWLPEKLEIQVARLERNRAPALSFGRYRRVDETGAPLDGGAQPDNIGEPGAHTLFRGNYIGCLTTLVDRRCLEHLGGFPLSPALQRGGQDYALWLRIALRYPLLYEPRVLANYVVHSGSRVGVDVVKNYHGALNAIGAVWERDGELCRQTLGRPYSAFMLRQIRLMCQRLVMERTLDRKTWARAYKAAWSAVSSGPSGQRAIWPLPFPDIGGSLD